jgi:hypothetical protein
VREVETTFATPSRDTYHTSAGIGPSSTFSAIRHALPHGKVVVWKRPVDGRVWGSWYVMAPGRVVTEFDLGQVPQRTGAIDPRVRGYQVRVGCPGTSRLPQFKGRPAAGPC